MVFHKLSLQDKRVGGWKRRRGVHERVLECLIIDDDTKQLRLRVDFHPELWGFCRLFLAFWLQVQVNFKTKTYG